MLPIFFVFCCPAYAGQHYAFAGIHLFALNFMIKICKLLHYAYLFNNTVIVIYNA